jgi:hypothetical protein
MPQIPKPTGLMDEPLNADHSGTVWRLAVIGVVAFWVAVGVLVVT